MIILCTERLADSDLPRPFHDGDQHNIHHADTADDQRNSRDYRHGKRHDQKHIVDDSHLRCHVLTLKMKILIVSIIHLVKVRNRFILHRNRVRLLTRDNVKEINPVCFTESHQIPDISKRQGNHRLNIFLRYVFIAAHIVEDLCFVTVNADDIGTHRTILTCRKNNLCPDRILIQPHCVLYKQIRHDTYRCLFPVVLIRNIPSGDHFYFVNIIKAFTCALQ